MLLGALLRRYVEGDAVGFRVRSLLPLCPAGGSCRLQPEGMGCCLLLLMLHLGAVCHTHCASPRSCCLLLDIFC